ncbi:MAG: hypothetical protein ACM30E_09465 [Nitrososphaerales archaeon]
MRVFTVSGRHSGFLYLLVAVSLLLSLVGPAQVAAAREMRAPALAPQACASYVISQSSDDAVSSANGSTINLTANPMQTYVSSDYRMWGLRFQNVTVPQGATITSASLTFVAQVANTSSGPTQRWYGNDVDNAVTFTTTAGDLTNRTKTTAYADWTIPAFTANTSYTANDLTTVVQAIVGRANWVSGNAMAFLGQAQSGTAVNKAVYSWDYSGANEPSLTICWQAGPAVTINQAAGQSDPTNVSPVNFTVVFSEPVTGFETGYVSLTGTAGATTGAVTEVAPNDGTTYNVAVSGMTGSGTVIASIPAGVAQNGSSQPNVGSTSTGNTVAYDITNPTVTINQASGQADPTTASPINFTVVFSEAVTGFATGDVTLDGTAGPTTAVVTGSGATYNVAVSGMTGSGTVIASIAAGAAHDAAGNPNEVSTTTDDTVTFELDTTPPMVTIDQAAGQVDPTYASPINFTVVFSEPVTDFATGDVALAGTASATTAVVTGSGTTYNVAVSGMAASGTVIAGIGAGAAHDEAGNPSAASTSSDDTVAFDKPAPVTLDGAVSSGTADATASSVSFSHTTGAGANRLMLVGVSWNCGTTNRTISSITLTPDGGPALDLTEVRTQQYTWTASGSTNYRYTAIYRLLNPDPAVSGLVNITFSGAVSNGIIAGAANFAGVDQTTPLGSPNGAVGTGTLPNSAANPTVTLTGLSGFELIFDSVFIGASNTAHTMMADSGQSELWNILGYTSGSSFNAHGAASTKQATGTSATMSWTTGGYGTTATRWAIAAVPINPDTTPPALDISGATADGVAMEKDLATGGYILPTTNDAELDHLIQFAEGTAASEPLANEYFPLKLIDSTVGEDGLKAYYDDRGVPEPYLGYLKAAAEGVNPFVYIKGNGSAAVTLVDAAKHDLGFGEVGMTVPDNFPLGAYTVEGKIKDLAGNEAKVTLTLIVGGGTPEKPAKPAVSGARTGDNGQNVRLTWPKVNADVNGRYTYVTEYQLFRSVVPYVKGDRVTEYNGTDLYYDDAGIADSPGCYFYTVQAVNSINPSDNSNPVGVFTFPLLVGSGD